MDYQTGCLQIKIITWDWASLVCRLLQLCLIIVCSSFLLLSLTRESCASWLCTFLDNWKYSVIEPFAFSITKTCLYNFDPLKPHFYIVKLWFTGVHISFHISAQNIDCGYSLEPPRRGGSNESHNLCFEQKYEKYQNFYLKIFIFFGGKIFNIFE